MVKGVGLLYGMALLNHALLSYEVSFQNYKDKVVKQSSNTSCYNRME